MTLTTPPFAGAEQPEVVARVVYRYVELAYRRDPEAFASPRSGIKATLLPLLCWRDPVVSCAAWALQYAVCSGGSTTAKWLTHAVMASRAGLTFRHCYYAEYKASRRADPRVTNRGVRSRRPLPQP